MQHNRWLQWKLDHGLAVKGRAAGVALRPTTRIAWILGKYFIKGVPAIEIPGTRVFKQNVGGSIGSSGEV